MKHDYFVLVNSATDKELVELVEGLFEQYRGEVPFEHLRTTLVKKFGTDKIIQNVPASIILQKGLVRIMEEYQGKVYRIKEGKAYKALPSEI